MTTEPRAAVRVRLGHPVPVGAGWVAFLGADPPHVRLGVDEPGGAETVAWYAPGDVLTVGGTRWRVRSTSPPPRLAADAPPGAAGDHVVAVLVPADDALSRGPGPRRGP
ncbi:DUF6406 domain-containing protein [Jiangella anatolica]|uniref:DUF6406 domain-containing protein n=1 Tax=Jiangella anatolica TaxID=2670374 RepID=UPI0011B5AF78|nr:DUF6406 domain-containing protein [Jiangella anatolica]